jgi:Lysyl oxidase
MQPRPLLPDLQQEPPGSLQGVTSHGFPGLRFHLGFASAVDNVGTGPLVVVGERRSRAYDLMTADQLIQRSDGSTRLLRGVGKLRYVVSETHSHWHFLYFDRYELRRALGYALVRRDRKTGFCLGDRYESAPGHRLPHEPPGAVWTGHCGKFRPDLLNIREGISVGFGDDYKPALEGQYFDVTRLPAGRYVIVHRVNVGQRLRESNYTNNAASLAFDLRWPHGFGRSPTINVVRRCPDSALCA